MGPRLGNDISPCFFAFLRGGVWQDIPSSFLFFGEFFGNQQWICEAVLAQVNINSQVVYTGVQEGFQVRYSLYYTATIKLRYSVTELYGQIICVDRSYNSTFCLLFVISCHLFLFHIMFHVPVFQLSQSPFCFSFQVLNLFHFTHLFNWSPYHSTLLVSIPFCIPHTQDYGLVILRVPCLQDCIFLALGVSVCGVCLAWVTTFAANNVLLR